MQTSRFRECEPLKANGGPRRSSRREVLLTGLVAAGVFGKSNAADTLAQSAEESPVPLATPDAEAVHEIPAGIELVDGYMIPRSEPRQGGALHLQRPGRDVKNFNPSAFALDPQISISYLEPLVRPHPATLQPQPWLAESWHWQADGLELLLQLRQGITWHDDSPFDSDDARFSFQVYLEDVESAVSGLFSLVDSIEATSPHELRVRFSQRDASWLFNAATLPIFSRQQYEEYWSSLPATKRTLSGFDWSTSAPLGTGPWLVHSWEPSSVSFERNERFWRRPSWLNQMVVSIASSAATRWEEFENGRSDVLWPVRGSRIPVVLGTTARLYRVPAASVMFAAFNFANPSLESGSYWTDIRVRQAVSMAINRERYASEVFNGFIRWDAAGTVTQPWAHDADLKTAPFNRERASGLLGEAGWVDYNGDNILEDVNGVPMNPVVIVQHDARPELIALLARVGRDLAEVGVALSIETLSNDAFEQRWIASRDYDLIAYAYDQLPGFTDYDLYGSEWDIRTNPAGWNPGGYSTPDADEALSRYFEAISIERQAAALRDLQRVVDEDLFGLWFGFPDDLVLVDSAIDGYQPDMAWQTARTWDLWRIDSDG